MHTLATWRSSFKDLVTEINLLSDLWRREKRNSTLDCLTYVYLNLTIKIIMRINCSTKAIHSNNIRLKLDFLPQKYQDQLEEIEDKQALEDLKSEVNEELNIYNHARFAKLYRYWKDNSLTIKEDSETYFGEFYLEFICKEEE